MNEGLGELKCRRRFVPAFLASFTRCLYRCPKSLEVVFWYWSFCHSYSPSYILLFPFLLGYVYIVLSVSQNNSYIYVDNKLLLYIILYKRGECLCYIACVFDKHWNQKRFFPFSIWAFLSCLFCVCYTTKLTTYRHSIKTMP